MTANKTFFTVVKFGAMAIGALLFGLAFFLWLALAPMPQQARADAVVNFSAPLTMDAGSTAHTVAGAGNFTSTAVAVEGYGSVNIHVNQNYSGTGTVTYKLQLATKPQLGNCASLTTNWYDAYDRIIVANPAVAAGRYVSYTRTTTTTVPYNITYNYATVPAVAASVTVVEQARSFAVANDTAEGWTFDTDGARCARIVGTTTTTATVTTAIYATPLDLQE